ncbi:MAG: hypothetical protein ACRDTE_01680 [Pseudonocardiaceae bacterium]
MTGFRVAVLRSTDPDPADGWGDENAITSVLAALAAAGVPTDEQVVRSAADLEACRELPGLLTFPHSRRFGRGEPLVAPLVAWGVPVIGSGLEGLAAEDKAYTKTVLRRHGVPTPRGTVAGSTSDPVKLVSRVRSTPGVKPVWC